MPLFEGNSEKLELGKDLLQTCLKFDDHLVEVDRMDNFNSVLRGDALQTFKTISSPTPESFGKIPAVFRRKCAKPQSMATAEHEFQKRVFNPSNQKASSKD